MSAIRLSLVLEGRVLELVVVDRDREPVVAGVGREPARHRPRPEHAVLLEPQVEVVLRPVVLVEHEHRLPTSLPAHESCPQWAMSTKRE